MRNRVRKDAPLEGVSVLLTRPKDRNLLLVERLKNLGADVTAVPLIEIEPLAGEGVSRAKNELFLYDLIVFTSKNAVRHFALSPREQNPIPEIAVVGEATAEALRSAGIEPDLVGENKGSLRLAFSIQKFFNLKGLSILYPCSSLADTQFAEKVLSMGAKKVEMIPVYRTLMPGNIKSELLLGHDVIVFFSPSAVFNYFKALQEKASDARLSAVAAGKKTGAALLKKGVEKIEVADSTKTEYIIKATLALTDAQRGEK